jgi:hypothetical protein
MKVHIFGSVCSPAVCAYVLHRAAEDADAEDAPFAVQEVENQFYVDNWITSFNTEEEAIAGAAKLTRALAKGGFELAQWGSSSRSVLASLPGQCISALNVDLDGLPTERTLGMSLDFAADCFVLKATGNVSRSTHREILRATATNFDPLGCLAPVLITAKMILQKVCKAKLGWDDLLDQELSEEWQQWAGSLTAVNDLRIPRCYCPFPHHEDATDLIMFSDASERAFGAVGYLRFELPDGNVKVAFVLAKAKVAPVKYVSMPRLELCGCLMSARMASVLLKELRIKIRRVVLFTDSTTNLRWFNSESCRFTPYVANRVGEVLESFDATHWHYVPTLQNPADDLSRGVPASELTADHRFFTGPEFLLDPPTMWLAFPDLQAPLGSAPDPEVKEAPPAFAGTTKVSACGIETLLSSLIPWSRVKRTVALVLRWPAKFKERKRRGEGKPEPEVIAVLSSPRTKKFTIKKYVAVAREVEMEEPSPEELATVVSRLVGQAQRTAYALELKALNRKVALDAASPLAKVSPYLDQGLLRVGGRIVNAPVPFDVRHPIVLPPKAIVTERIVRAIHIKGKGHTSSWRTLSELQREYWIPAPRRLIRRVVDRCTLCRRFTAKAGSPLMAALPSARLQVFQPPFACTGIDYFGPIEVTLFRRVVKRWGCLFTCLTTRAIHLEMAYALDADAFICAYENFRVARGTPKIIYADNGTNFVGGKNELAEALERLNQSQIYNHLALEGVEWRFNPPAAPPFGGSWERLVGSAKRALERVLHLQSFTDQTLTSALKQVEHLINSRPLTYVSVDPSAPEPLTPYHLLLGRANPSIPPDVFSTADLSCRKRWRIAHAIADQFWRRWMAEYMPDLIERRKWLKRERNLRIGDIVLVIDEKTPRGLWPLGLVTEVFTGADGVVRSASVRHNGTELHRPAVKLCLLEPEPEKEEDASAAGRRAGDVPNEPDGASPAAAALRPPGA